MTTQSEPFWANEESVPVGTGESVTVPPVPDGLPPAPEELPADLTAAELTPPETPAGPVPATMPAPVPSGLPGASETVPPVTTATPVPTTSPELDQVTKQRLAYLEGIEARWRQQQLEQQLQSETSQYQKELEADGLLPEQAQRIAVRHYQTLKQVAAERQQVIEQQQYEQGKRNASRFFAQKYGVDPDSLLHYSSPEAMEAAAKTQQELLKLKQELAALKKGRVPAQKLDSNQPSTQPSRNSRDRWMEDVIKGRRVPTTEEFQKMMGRR